MGTLGSFVQKGALGTQGFAPSNVTGWLLQRAGVSLSPGQEAIRYGGKRAACCVSLDFDITEDSRAQPNHDGTHLHLYNAQRYGIPLTWAVCGMTVEKDPEPFEAV